MPSPFYGGVRRKTSNFLQIICGFLLTKGKGCAIIKAQ